MKAYSVDFQIIETIFINSSEFSSLRLRWETAVALQAETEQARHADISNRKRQSRQAVHSVFPSMQGIQIFGCSPSMPSEKQVQSAAPMEKPWGLQNTRERSGWGKCPRGKHGTDIFKRENTVAYQGIFLTLHSVSAKNPPISQQGCTPLDTPCRACRHKETSKPKGSLSSFQRLSTDRI